MKKITTMDYVTYAEEIKHFVENMPSQKHVMVFCLDTTTKSVDFDELRDFLGKHNCHMETIPFLKGHTTGVIVIRQ